MISAPGGTGIQGGCLGLCLADFVLQGDFTKCSFQKDHVKVYTTLPNIPLKIPLYSLLMQPDIWRMHMDSNKGNLNPK